MDVFREHPFLTLVAVCILGWAFAKLVIKVYLLTKRDDQ